MLALYIRRYCDSGNVHQSQQRLCNLLEMFTFHRCVIYQSKHFLRNLISRSPQCFYLSIRSVMNRPGKKIDPIKYENRLVDNEELHLTGISNGEGKLSITRA